MDTSSSLLINEPPLQVLPSLAVALNNVDKAIMIQQIHYWLQRSTNVRNGYKWVYNSAVGWQKQFPWIHSAKTVQRYLKDLEKQGLLITDNFNKAGFDRTKWYRIDYDALDKIDQRLGLSVPTRGTDDTNAMGLSYPTNTIDYTENTTEKEKEEKGSKTDLPNSSENKTEQARTSVFDFWEQNGFGAIPPILYERIDKYVDDFKEVGASEIDTYQLILFALNEAVDANVRNWNYVKTTLNGYLNQSIITIEQAKTNKKEWQQRKNNYANNQPSQKPVWDSQEQLKQIGKESSGLPF